MRYQIERCPQDPNAIGIHVDRRLIKGGVVSVDPTDDRADVKEELAAAACSSMDLAGFYEIVSEFTGIQHEMVFERYTIGLEKGQLFSWKDLEPLIIEALQVFIAGGERLENADPRKKVKKDGKPKTIAQVKTPEES